MSTTIDQRVVEMRLDNKQFEANAQASISTLSKLRQSLNLTGASKGLEQVSAAAKNNNMGVLGSAVEAVGVKFNAMQVIGTTALATLTHSAITAGTRIVKALTIDPVKTGFSEYELKMDSIKTIMASTGEDLEVVNKYLAELNEYSDQTIYSFSDMTQNIGKFTNAGIKLEDAVMAIKGISNEAALSGANANEASRAMYNFAQALSTGSVKLIDWKSIENANMATVEFKEELIKTALELGTIKKVGNEYKTTTTDLAGKTSDAFTATKGFNDALSHQWMTSDVLIKTLKKYGDETTDIGKRAAVAATEVNTFSKMCDTLKESAQSGWAQTWEILFGDANQSKKMWTTMSNGIGKVIDAMSDARNNTLERVMTSPWEQLTKEINEAGIETDDFRKKLFKTAKDHYKSLNKMKYSEKNFNKILEDGRITKDVVIDTLENMIKGTEGVGDSTEDLQKKLKKFQQIVDQVWKGDFKNGEERVKALAKAGYDYADVQALVNKTVGGHKLTLEDLSDAQLTSIGYTKEEITALRKLEKQARDTGTPIGKLIEDLSRPSGREMLGDIVKKLGSELKKLTDATKDAWNDVFGDKDASDGIYNIISNLKKLTDEFTITEDQANSFKSIIQGAFSAVELTWNLTGLGLRAGLKIMQAVLELFGTDLLTVAGHIGDLITKFAKWAQENTIWWGYTQNIAKIVFAIVEGVYDCVKAFLELKIAGKIIDKVAEWLSNLFGGVDFDGATNHIEALAKVISNWFDKLKKDIKKIDKLDINISWKSFQNFIDYLSEKIPGFKEFVQIIKDIKSELTKLFDSLSLEYLGFDSEAAGGDIVEGLKKGITSKYPDAVASIKNLGIIIKEAFCKLLGIASPSKVFIALGGFIVAGLIYGLEDSTSLLASSVKSLVTTLFDTAGAAIKTGLPFLIEKLGDIFGNILTQFATMDIDFGSLFVIGTVAVVAFFLKKILDLLERLAKPLDGIADVSKSIDGVLKQFKDNLKATNMAIYADALKSLAISVAIMVGSLMLLRQINLKEDWDALLVMGGLIGALIGLAAIAQKVEPTAFAKLALFGLALSASLWIIATAIKKLADIDPSRAFAAVIDFGLVIGAFAGLMYVYGKFVKGKSAENIDKAAILIAKIGLSIGIIAFAMKLMSSLSVEDIGKGMLFIAGVGVLFGAIVSIAKYTGMWAAEAGKLLLKMSIAIGIIAFTMKLISTMSTGDIGKGLFVVAAVELLFVGIIQIAKKSGPWADVAGKTMIKMSIAIGILALVIKLLADVPAGDIAKGMIVIASSVFLFKAFIKMTKDAGANAGNAGSMLWKMAAAIGVLALAMRILSGMSIGDIAKGLIIIGVLELMFVGVTKLMKSSSTVSKYAGDSFKKMAVAILILAGAIAILSVLDTKKVLGATAAISAIILCLSLLTHVSKLSEGTKIDIKALITMSIAIGILAGIIALLTLAGDPNAVLASAISLTLLVGVLAGVLKLLSTMPVVSKGAIGALALLGLVVGELAVILGLLAYFNVEPSIETSAALVILLAGLAGVCYLMSGLGAIAGPAAVGILAFGGLVAELGLVIAAFGTVGDKGKELISKGADTLHLIGDALGQFVGGVIGGIGDGIAKSLVSIGTNLSKFMDEASGFIEGAKSIDSDVSKGMLNLAEAILTLTGAGILEKLGSLFIGESSFGVFSDDLEDFGDGLAKFASKVTDIDGSSLTGAMDVAKTLVELADTLPNSGGLAGNNDMDKFGEQIEGFGKGINSFYESVKDIEDADKLNKIIKIIASISNISGNLPSTGGLFGKIFGETDLASFGTQLEDVGTSLNTFAGNLGEFGEDQLDTVKFGAKAIKAMVNAASGIEGQGGWFDGIFGDNSIGTFAKQLPDVGKALAKFAGNLGTFGKDQVDTVTCAVDAIAGMAKASQSIDGQSDFGRKLFGDNSIGGFAAKMPDIGENLADFVGKLGTFGKDQVDTVTCAVDAIAGMAKAGKGIDGQSKFGEAVFGENGLGGVANKMPNIGTKLKEFAGNLGTFDESKVSTVESAAKAINALAKLSGADLQSAKTNLPGFAESIPGLSDGIRSFANNMPEAETVNNAITLVKNIIQMVKDVAKAKLTNLTEFTNGLSEMGKAGVTAFVTAFTSEDAKTDVKEAAENLLKKAVEGAKTQKEPFKTAATKIASAAVSALKSDTIFNDFYGAGVYLGAGLTEGIESQYQEAYDAGFKLGQKAVQGEKDGQKSNSPSEATKKAGRWLGEGLIIGIQDMTKKVYTAGQDLGNDAVDSMSSVVSKILDAINSDVDFDPTIRPVLDLSGVSDGANKLNGMFNMGTSIGVNANVGTISAMMNRMNQNGVNDGVISAIDKLRSELGNTGRDTYIIDGITYDDGSNVSDAVKTLVRAAKMERRV